MQRGVPAIAGTPNLLYRTIIDFKIFGINAALNYVQIIQDKESHEPPISCPVLIRFLPKKKIRKLGPTVIGPQEREKIKKAMFLAALLNGTIACLCSFPEKKGTLHKNAEIILCCSYKRQSQFAFPIVGTTSDF